MMSLGLQKDSFDFRWKLFCKHIDLNPEEACLDIQLHMIYQNGFI